MWGTHPAVVLSLGTSILQCSQHLTLQHAHHLRTLGRKKTGERDREAKAPPLTSRHDNMLDSHSKCHTQKHSHESAQRHIRASKQPQVLSR